MDGTATSPRRLRVFLVAAGAGVAGLATGAALTTGTLLGLAAAGFPLDPVSIIVVSLLLTQGVGFGGFALAYLRLRDLPLGFVRVRTPTLRDLIWAGSGYVLAFLGVTAAGLLVQYAGAPPVESQVGRLAQRDPTVLLLLIPGSFLLIGPGEELLFRGIVQGTLREAFGPAPAVAVASAIFAATHATALLGSPAGVLVVIGVLFIPSLVLGAAYERTGNLVVPVFIHGAYDATLFGLVYLSLRYAPAG